MKLVSISSALLSAAFLALAAFAAPGCSQPTLRDLCQQTCECSSDTTCETAELQADVDECTTFFEGLRDADEDRGCGDEFDTLWRCYYAADQCPTPENLCPDEQAAYDACGG